METTTSRWLGTSNWSAAAKAAQFDSAVDMLKSLHLMVCQDAWKCASEGNEEVAKRLCSRAIGYADALHSLHQSAGGAASALGNWYYTRAAALSALCGVDLLPNSDYLPSSDLHDVTPGGDWYAREMRARLFKMSVAPEGTRSSSAATLLAKPIAEGGFGR
jgi:hypothetical protein